MFLLKFCHRIVFFIYVLFTLCLLDVSSIFLNFKVFFQHGLVKHMSKWSANIAGKQTITNICHCALRHCYWLYLGTVNTILPQACSGSAWFLFNCTVFQNCPLCDGEIFIICYLLCLQLVSTCMFLVALYCGESCNNLLWQKTLNFKRIHLKNKVKATQISKVSVN